MATALSEDIQRLKKVGTLGYDTAITVGKSFKSFKQIRPTPGDNGMPSTNLEMSSQPASRPRGASIESTSSLLPRTVTFLKRDSKVTNKTTTAKYTCASFLPQAFYELFHPTKHFANAYFLMVGFAQMMKQISLTDGTPMVWLNLGFVLIQDLIAMGFEDYQRHKADRQMNNRKVEVLSENSADFKARTWAAVRVGDIVRPQTPTRTEHRRPSRPPPTVYCPLWTGENQRPRVLPCRPAYAPSVWGYSWAVLDQHQGEERGSAE